MKLTPTPPIFPSVGEDGKIRENHLPTRLSDAEIAKALGQYRGTGFPNGVVTAPVGSIYTDTAATSGAIRWIKETGTGNSGWAIDYGDTGWRGLDTLIAAENFLQGSVVVRRRNNTVEVVGYGLRAPEESEELKTLLTLPNGFFPGYTARYGSTYWGKRWHINPWGLITFGQLAGDDYFSVLFTSETSWPTSLPGTPV